LSPSIGKKFKEIEEIRPHPGLQRAVAAPIAGTADLVGAEGDFSAVAAQRLQAGSVY
jgi:hypothetical protein